MPIYHNRGSEWRKWDLHIHSDASPDSNLTPEIIVDKLIEKGISVFALTDHSCVDNIDRIWELIKQKNNDGKYLYFLPGIELKTDKGDKSVHITGIFPEYDKNGHHITSLYLKENFLSKIDCTESNLINIGKEKLDKGKTNEEYRKRGKLEFYVSFEKASNLIKGIGGVCIVHAGSKTSSIEEEIEHEKSETEDELLNSLGHLKEELMKNYIDICELSNWKYSNLRQSAFYLNKFKKPSIVCSDSHEIGKIGTKFTWIKADPTFEGLRQILYEPEGRARIQEQKPEDKTSYLVIDKVRFLDKSTNPKFSDEWIEINPNLTGIIGGKSSGKSLLLYHIAKTIDPIQVNNRVNDLPVPQYSFDKDENFDFEVQWKDGEVCKLSDSIELKKRRITYLPQMYINLLAEAEAEQSLNNQILDILLQNKIFKEYYETKLALVKDNTASVSHEVINLFKLIDELGEERDEMRKMGDKRAIINEISKIMSQIDYLRKISGFSDEENTIYEGLSKRKEIIKKETLRIQALKDNLEELKNYLLGLEDHFPLNIVPRFEEYRQKSHNDQEAIHVFNNIEDRVLCPFSTGISNLFSRRIDI